MHRALHFLFALSIAAALAVQPAGDARAAALLVTGTGDYRMPVRTSSEEARRYFQQGVVLAWAFNFAEAVRSFREAARLDPRCALCHWGIAYALGPSINHDMTAREAAAAWRAVRGARELAVRADPYERELILALAKRYARDLRAGRSARDAAYARAMRKLAEEHPDNADVLTLAAEAEMDLHPRDYWEAGGAARTWTPQIIAWLERALTLAPRHPGANHYLVHALEDSREPQRALAAAQRLESLTPGMGHLVHLSAHLYMRLGRYREAIDASRREIEADRAYLRAARAAPAYIEGYVRHNVYFLWAAAFMDGAKEIAREAAAPLAEAAIGRHDETAQHYLALPLYNAVRFGEWAALREAPRPPRSAPYTLGVWHYARGVAYLRLGDQAAAARELHALDAIARHANPRDDRSARYGEVASLGIAGALLRAEIASAQGDKASAVAHAEQAVTSESALERGEPPIYVFAAREFLARLAASAAKVYLDQKDSVPPR